MKKSLVLGLMLIASQAFGQDYTATIYGKEYRFKPTPYLNESVIRSNGFDPLKTGLVGVSMFLSSVALADEKLPWGHATELQAWSFCWTYMGFRFLPGDFKWVSPILVTAFDFSYRTEEWKKIDPTGANITTMKKFFCDFSGVLGAMVMEMDLDKKKDIHLDVSMARTELTVRF